ncbi:MAG: MAPEG family protein [Halieaceae bacterium]|jgi:glutathione S-transferase|nr:MAPEG family protein [Halieaceae bacterium]
MLYVAIVTLILLCQYIFFMGMVGKARVAGGVEAPAVTGDPIFERAYRVQMNTLEQLMVTLPAMWVCAQFFMPLVAAGLGLAFFIGRIIYRSSYMAAPEKRGLGMMIGFLANIGMIGTGFWGVISRL